MLILSGEKIEVINFIFAGFGECQGRRIKRHQVVYLGSQPISKWLKRNGIRACATLLMLAPPLVASYIVSDAFYSASNFAVSGFLADCGSLLYVTNIWLLLYLEHELGPSRNLF
jgi:hypothetical protein